MFKQFVIDIGILNSLYIVYNIVLVVFSVGICTGHNIWYDRMYKYDCN